MYRYEITIDSTRVIGLTAYVKTKRSLLQYWNWRNILKICLLHMGTRVFFYFVIIRWCRTKTRRRKYFKGEKSFFIKNILNKNQGVIYYQKILKKEKFVSSSETAESLILMSGLSLKFQDCSLYVESLFKWRQKEKQK